MKAFCYMLTIWSLQQAVESYNSFSERYQLLCGVDGGAWEDWALESLAKVLEDSSQANEHDGFAVCEVLKKLPKDHQVMQR